MIKNWFISPDDDRIRAGWRIAYQLLLFFVLSFLLVGAALWVGIVTAQSLNSFAPRDLLVNKTIEFIALATALYLARKMVDKKSPESLGFQDKFVSKDILLGIGIAFLMITALQILLGAAGYTTIAAFTWQHITNPQWLLSIFFMLASLVLVALNEETLFRGYIFLNLEEGLNTRWAILLSALMFATPHLFNPSGNAAMPFLGIMLAGLFFAWVYTRTRTLWLPIGLHLGWNFFLGPIYGLTVSGLDFPGVLSQTISGPELITGGAFGPEAGLVLLPALALGVWLVARGTRDRVGGIDK